MSELLSNKRLKKKNVNLALIGMSGTGKSYWSKKMENSGFRRYSCDNLIAERLSSELGNKGKSTLNLAKWMGKPYSEGYLRAESLYLKLEEEVLTFICDELENSSLKDEPVVVDTTGSLIYLNTNLLNRLRKLVRTVHLTLPVQKHNELFESYLVEPKPLIWKGKYIPLESENQQNTLRRCYSELLAFRNERYSLISDCELEFSFHHCPKTRLNEILEIVSNFFN